MFCEFRRRIKNLSRRLRPAMTASKRSTRAVLPRIPGHRDLENGEPWTISTAKSSISLGNPAGRPTLTSHGTWASAKALSDVGSSALSMKRLSMSVAVTTGTYDVFAWATLPNAETLGRFLRDQVGTIGGVRRTETFVNLAVVKRSAGIPV